MISILFDLDGVFYQGNSPIKGGAEVIDWVNDNDVPYLFVTNTSSRPRSELIEKLYRFNINTDESHIFTPAVASIHWLKTHFTEPVIAPFIPLATQSEYSGFSTWPQVSSSVDALIIGDLGEAWTFDILNQAFRLLMQKPQPELIALGMTRYWQADDGLRLDVAPFVVALEHASNIKSLVMGKPAHSFYQAAVEMLSSQPETTLMIGDDIRGDIEGAQNAGLRAILVKTGKFRAEDLQQNIQPDAILDSIKELPDWLQQHKS